MTLLEIINLIDKSEWAKAKHHWATQCIQMKPASEAKTSITFDFKGSIHDIFIKKISTLQSFNLAKKNVIKTNR